MQTGTTTTRTRHARLSEIAGSDVFQGEHGVLYGTVAGLTRVAAYFGFKYSSSSARTDTPRLFLTAAKLRRVA